MKYYCGAEDCPGHSRKTDSCAGYDTTDSSWNMKSLNLRIFRCGAPGCPGHFLKTEKCPNLFVLEPKLFELRRFKCDAPKCPGHFSQTDKCLNLIAPLPKSFELKRFKCGAPDCPGHFSKSDKCPNFLKIQPIPIELKPFYCGAPNCPGHLNKSDKCKVDTFLLLNQKEITNNLSINTPIQASNMDVNLSDSSYNDSYGYGETLGVLVIILVFAALFIFLIFGFERTLVAVEGFFIFAGWAGLRAAKVFGDPKSAIMKNFSSFMAIGFGICCGVFASYLILTTSEGQKITEFVTANTVRIIGSLFASVMMLSLIELIWGTVSK